MFHHYGPVWEQLERGEFELVAAGPADDRARTCERAARAGYQCVDADELLDGGERYRHLVSNHPLEMSRGKRLVELLGVTQIRFMYALGKARHNFADWNRLYRLILCFGPYQAQHLAFATESVKVQMGYPRYDHFFSESVDKEVLRQRFGCDPARKTLVWLPTWMGLSSIDQYAYLIALLSEQYNVIVKPHPLTIRSEPERVARLQAQSFTRVITEMVDNLDLYRIADWVLCDYGGPIFGAIYLDKNLALLNVPGAEGDALTGADSAEIGLRKVLPNFNESELYGIWDLLEDEEYCRAQSMVRRGLREQFFAPNYGNSAAVAARALRQRDSLLAGQGMEAQAW